jgi:NTP pyrophosphatase (non-canonical NTP hydrolase)
LLETITDEVAARGSGSSEQTLSELHEEVKSAPISDFEDCTEDERRRVAEEAADALITVHILCELIGIDIADAYKKKMRYNLTKSGERDENGKVVDDGG